jgi:AraC-like DNA-binding protein
MHLSQSPWNDSIPKLSAVLDVRPNGTAYSLSGDASWLFRMNLYVERDRPERPASPVEDFLSRVRRCAERLPDLGQPGIETVARALNLSMRTLQRRLEDEGTTFSGLWDDLRHQRAKRLLLDRRLAIKQVAVMLGFSEPSTFYRAFRRWTGVTPAHFRRSLMA